MKKYKIDFNKAHIGYVNDNSEEIVGATTALNLLEKFGLHYYYYSKGRKGIDFQTKDPSALIGTITHAKIMCHLKKIELDKSNITPEQDRLSDNCLKSYFEWVKDKDIKPVVVEKSLVSKQYNYGGTLDLICLNNNKYELWDYKSSKDIYEEYIAQIVSYLKLALENMILGDKKISRLLILNIPKTKDGNFKIASYDPDSEIVEWHFNKFLKCVDIWNINNVIKSLNTGKELNEIINPKDDKDFYNFVKRESNK